MNKLEENIINYNTLKGACLKDYEKIYNSNLNGFSKLIDNIASYHKTDLSWLSQSILSKNKFLSNIYFEYCRLEVLKKRLRINYLNKILVNDNNQKKIIQKNFDKNYLIEFIVKNKEARVYFTILKNFILNIKFSFILFCNKSQKRKNNFLEKNNITLLENFFYLRKKQTKEYSDRYYGNLLYLTKEMKNISIFFLFQVIDMVRLNNQISSIEKYKINFITIFDFLNLFDYIKAIIKVHHIRTLKNKKISYKELDLTYLFYNEYKKTFNNLNAYYGILQFLFFKRLKKEIKSNKIKHVVDWYENQSIDKGFNLGLNLFFPKVPTIGYQPFAVDYNYYCHLLPSKGEIKNKLTPKKIAFLGKKVKAFAIKKFKLKKSKVIIGPSLRFNNIFNKKYIIKKDTKIKNILLALPVTHNDSVDIICLVNSYIEKYKNHNYKFYINYHPLLNFEKIKYKYNFIKKNFIISNKNFTENYQKFDCVVSNSSSLCFESLAHGIPVIIVKSNSRITHNPIAHVKHGSWKPAQNLKQFVEALKYLLSKKNKKSFNKISNTIKKDYFSPNNEINLNKLLGIN